MQASTERRQNHSCDQCRKSKRRCVVVADSGCGQKTCRNCRHLGNTCTYEFASAHAERRQKTKATTIRLGLNDDTALHTIAEQTSGLPTPLETDWRTSSTTSTTHESALEDSVDWMRLNPVGGCELDVFFENFIEGIPETPMLQESSGEQALLSDVSALQRNCADVVQTQGLPEHMQDRSSFDAPVNGPPSTFSLRSPVSLLNSSFTAKLANAYLAGIYGSMMDSLTLRWLSYRSNVFAGPYCYDLRSERVGQKPLECGGLESPDFADPVKMTSCLPLLSQLSTSSKHKDVMRLECPYSALGSHFPNTTAQRSESVTLIGACRFLDNFGPLFGNKIDQNTRDGQELAFERVIQAFALQYAPISPRVCVISKNNDDQELGVDSAKPFKIILVQCAISSDGIDSGLLILASSSLRLVKWYAYTRDTLASLLSNRKCVLEDVNLGANDCDVVPPPSFDGNFQQVSTVCHFGAASIFALYRKVIHLRKLIAQESEDEGAQLARDLLSGVNMIEYFTVAYEQWIQECTHNFDGLSVNSKISYTFFVVFWNLGVLYMVEQIQQSAVAARPWIGFDILNRGRQYQ
ncbi:hypothetical protein EV356DRAFT_531155 [Viridothelium virens]|uniref:Zn(2)-C6 fungal-type domain-containing protein n=1 Tax=Viridothelium virens TaxID=1048519 RepID=A0A6A6HFH2_VIRVR|nr:hypothetical protein EV356DRAFT_531155 [Viridothelium virens]